MNTLRTTIVIGLTALAIVLTPVLSCASILVISPHPDDDVLSAAGITYAAIQRSEPVLIVYMTNGDLAGIERGYLRQGEAVNAQVGYLGNIENSLIFLGYPDAYLSQIFSNYTGETDEFMTSNGQSTTYGNRGLGRSDFHSYAFGHPALYNLYNILMDLKRIITDFTPDHIFTTSEFDDHPDHSITYQVVRLALLSAMDTIPGYTPTLHETFVWGGGGWPEPMDPTTYFTEPAILEDTPLQWNERESIEVPLIMQSTNYGQNPKFMAIEAHESQGGTSGFLGQFIHKDEFFWIDTSLGSSNHAPIADAGSDQIVNEGAQVVLDGSGSSDPDGTPLAFEWLQTQGTSVQLSSSTTVNPTFTAPTGLAQNEHLVFQLIVSDGQLTSIPNSVIITVQTGSPPPVTENIASLATVTASSESPANGQLAIKAVDGVADGYPGDYTREWATQHEGVGAWLDLAWSTPYIVNRIVLYDRPNTDDQILAGTISFSDGSTLQVGPLVNSGLATEYVFSERTITSLRLSITQVKSSTSNIGLSEIEVYRVANGGSNHAPVATNDAYSTAEDTVLTVAAPGVLGNDTDVDGNPLTAVLVSNVSNGTLTLNANGSFTYSPATNYTGTDTFTYRANDGSLNSNTATVAITINGVNQAPVAVNDAYSTNQNTTLTIAAPGVLANDTDFENQPLTATLMTGPPHGTLTLNVNGSFTYAPATDYTGTDTFTYTANDGLLNSNTATVTITIQTESPPENIASLATVTASSESPANGQLAIKAVDGVADGYPGDYTREWATQHEGVGAWLDLAWSTPYIVNRIVLYDRPNTDDQILAGTISFSDGSTLQVGPLVNSGLATEYVFSERTITSLRLSITQVKSSTSNIGLSEIEVYTVTAANNPVPTTTSLSSSSATAGGAAFTLTVNGTNFISGSVVRWNGANRTTTYVSSMQLTASILAADIATAGTASVTVFNPTPGGGTSNAQTFTINVPDNPVPTTTSLSPSSATAGGSGFTLTVNGTNFISGSVVRWNGTDCTTTYVSATQLTAAILAADIATAGTASVTVFNPAPGGGTSNPQTFTINVPDNPVPTTTSLSPSSATAGGSGFTLTVNGTNFISSSVVRWNGTDRTTTYVSATQLTAAILAADIATAGTANVTVFNPTPGGGTSNAQTFTINVPDNPVPTTTSLSPSSATAGGAGFTLTVNGTNFISGSVVRWNGSNRTTTYVSSTQVTASILAADIATAGTASVTVFNPTPGGGTSNAQTFTINVPDNPLPTTTSLNPSSATAGGAGFTLTVNGTNFVSGSVVRWNGTNRTTTYLSGTQLTASILAADIATAGTANVTVFNPTPGGGTSNAQTFTINVPDNPVPTTTSLSPSSATAGGSGFTLTVNGTNFISGSVVRWNGADRTTTFVSATRLTAAIPASDIAVAGTAQVTVFSPPPGGGTSSARTFTVNNPSVPTISSLSPSSRTAGGAAFTLTVNGSNFVASSVVRWNGEDHTTTFVSTTRLTAAIAASDIAVAGTVPVTVFTPAPGGGTSSARTFTINNPSVPTISSLSPSSRTAGGAAFTLTVNGSNFVASSVVRWNGEDRATTFVSTTRLTAAIAASDIAVAGTVPVTVFTPAPGGGTSNALTLTINNLVPTISSLSPTTANAGRVGFTLTVNGNRFVTSSVVRWNGEDRTTTFVSATRLTVAIPASDIAVVGTAQVTVFSPPPGGGTSSARTFTINNPPVPTISSLSPTTRIARGPAFTLTVNGSGFVTDSVVQWNGEHRTTTFVSATRLTAAIPASDIAVAGTTQVTVFTPPSGGGTSNALTLTINNPSVPTISSLSPSSATAGGAAFTLTITGSNFVTDSVVRWNGADRTTTFVSSTQLTAAVDAADIAVAGTAQVRVFTPAPGGGTSAARTFTIN